MARGYPDYEGNKAGLYLIPEWTAKEGTDKTFSAYLPNQGIGGLADVTYTVPAGKTLYITQLSWYTFGTLAADRDLNQMNIASITDLTADEDLWFQGGNAGGGMTFPKPIVIPSGNSVRFRVYNFANHNCSIGVVASGYEV